MLLIANAQLLNDCSNTTRTNGSTTFTVSEWRVAEAKWLFFVHFVGENTDFPLCPCGFWGFCYHSVITVIVYYPSRITILNFLLHNI